MFISSIKKEKEFDFVNKYGVRYFSKYFTLVIYLESKNNVSADIIEQDKHNEIELIFGMKVGKKLGNAVIRNKIKRRIRHLMRIMANEHKASSVKIILIFIPKKNFQNILFSELISLLHFQFKRALNQVINPSK